MMVALALIYPALAAKQTNEPTLIGGANRNTEKFGLLHATLGNITAIFTDHAVRSYGHLSRAAL